MGMRKGNVPFVAGWKMNPEEWTIGSLLDFLTWVYESLWDGKMIYATLELMESVPFTNDCPKETEQKVWHVETELCIRRTHRSDHRTVGY